MYKLAKPIRCPNCGEIVQVDTSMIPQYKWECPKCGRTGTVGSKDDIITFENQTPIRTLPYIQKVDEPDLGVGVTITNADENTRIDVIPATYSTNTRCIICGEEFGFDGAHRICPKCREAIVKLRGTADSTANTMPENKSPVTAHKTTECNIPAPQFIQQGWQCPKCGAILAPNQHYCPFCSQSEYGRTNWLGTNTPTSGQYMNPNPSTTISLGDKPKKSDSCTATFATPSNNIKATQ